MIRKVAWCNVWNHSAALHGDYGSLVHLTEDGISGKTFCGRVYPATKGYPFAPKLCKRCLKSLQKRGTDYNTKLFEYVPSIGD